MTATASRLARTSDGDLHVGSSGWSYPSWRPEFYPAGLANEEFLSFYSARLPSVEVWAVDPWREHVAAIASGGLRVTGQADFVARVHAAFDLLAARFPERYVVVDGARPLLRAGWTVVLPAGTAVAAAHADRVVDVDFGGNLTVTLQVVAPYGSIAYYASRGNLAPILPARDFERTARFYEKLGFTEVPFDELPERIKQLMIQDDAAPHQLDEGHVHHFLTAR